MPIFPVVFSERCLHESFVWMSRITRCTGSSIRLYKHSPGPHLVFPAPDVPGHSAKILAIADATIDAKNYTKTAQNRVSVARAAVVVNAGLRRGVVGVGAA